MKFALEYNILHYNIFLFCSQLMREDSSKRIELFCALNYKFALC